MACSFCLSVPFRASMERAWVPGPALPAAPAWTRDRPLSPVMRPISPERLTAISKEERRNSSRRRRSAVTTNWCSSCCILNLLLICSGVRAFGRGWRSSPGQGQKK